MAWRNFNTCVQRNSKVGRGTGTEGVRGSEVGPTVGASGEPCPVGPGRPSAGLCPCTGHTHQGAIGGLWVGKGLMF